MDAPGPAPYSTVSFLSDFGLADEFVGVVKSVIHGRAPGTTIVDLTHEVPPHDVRAGGLTLARAIQYVAEGVVLAVVDPGVGTERRAVGVEVAEGRAVLIGPDNGLLAPAVSLTGGADRAVALTNPDLQLPAPGATFAARDVFAPAAAHLCAGGALDDLGERIDPAGLVPGMLPLPRVEDGEVVCEVLWVDRFGNAQLNVGPEDVEELGDSLSVRWGDGEVRTARRAGAYGELGTGELGLVIDSYGLLALSLDRASAAATLGVGAGDEVRLVEPT